MSQPRRRAGAFGIALLLTSLGLAAPARATSALSLDLPRHRLLATDLQWKGSGGDAPAAPFMHPMLGEGLAGFGAGLVTVPLMLLAGVAMNNASPDLAGAAIPPLLLFMAVPAVGVSFSQWAVGRALGADVHVQPAVYVGLGVQLVAFLIGAVTNVGPRDFGSMALFSVLDALALSVFVGGTMNLQAMLAAPPPKPAPTTDIILPATAPVARHAETPSTAGVSLLAGAF